MMFIIYDLIILISVLIYLPVYLFKKKFHPGFEARLGILPKQLELDNPIWIHAVSVGEAMSARNLVRELRAAYPDKKFFITTVTPTGNKIASSIAKENDFVSYFPLDLSFIVKKVVDKIRPSLFIVMETEIWPNFISYLYRKKIPMVLVNGRLSDRSFKGYRSMKLLIKPALNKISLFCVQAKLDAERFSHLGVFPEKIKITGNMKFDNADYLGRKLTGTTDKYRLLLCLGQEEKLWVCGSTHPGEEEIILGAYKKLLGEFPYLKLLIAPRHPQRSHEVENIVSGFGLRAVFVSGLPDKPCNCIASSVFILDVIGELVYYYNLASVVFVGGSLVKKGGHNILEPAGLGKPVVMGPYMFNFRDIAGLFLENRACILVNNKEELWANIKDLLSNPDKGIQLIQRAKAVILQNQGATYRNLEYINNYISARKGG